MIIDFSKVEEKALPNFKGGEKEYNASIVDDGVNKIMRGRLVPGASIGMHTHTDSCEVMFFTEGTATVVTPEGEYELTAGQCHYCPKGATHSLVNRGDTDLRFYAVVPAQ